MWFFFRSQMLEFKFLQRTPVMLHDRLRKWCAWVYLREIINSLDDRRLMLFEWYHLQAAALLTLLSLKWKHVDLHMHVCVLYISALVEFSRFTFFKSRYKESITGLWKAYLFQTLSFIVLQIFSHILSYFLSDN